MPARARHDTRQLYGCVDFSFPRRRHRSLSPMTIVITRATIYAACLFLSGDARAIARTLMARRRFAEGKSFLNAGLAAMRR